MSNKVNTAIFPVAGLGTRFLPATKATPKELLPVIDTPLIQFAIDEAREAGISRMVFVNHPSKSAIEDYVRHDARLSRTLRQRGKDEIAETLEEMEIGGDEDAVFVMQHEPLGLGHAVLCAREHVLPGPVAVILPDDLMLGTPGCLAEMVEAYESVDAGHMVAAMEVERENVSKYGVLDVIRREGRAILASGMVEKPAAEDAPSLMAAVGRYVLDPGIFHHLATQKPGAGGEIQLTDAIARGIAETGLAGWEFSGERFDCGSKAGMLAATLRMAGEKPALSEVVAQFGIEPRAGLGAGLPVAAE